jgi:hypothetical protein
MELFSGRTDALGSGAGRVGRGSVLRSHYAEHLEGLGDGIGVFPLLDDGTVRFAAIDLDEPDFELAFKMKGLLPGQAWVERSRSGNAHVWVFFEEPAQAWAVRGVLQSAIEAVGKKRVEVFPKQDKLGEGMLGNYINLPYHGLQRPILHLSSPGESDPTPIFQALTPKGFAVAAIRTRNDPSKWLRVAKSLGVLPPDQRAPTRTHGIGQDEHLHECAAYIIEGVRSGERPITEGHRSVVYFNLAKQLLLWREMTKGEAWDLLEELNGLSPDPLPRHELRRVFNNAASERYTSTGCDDPVMGPFVSPTCPIARSNA